MKKGIAMVLAVCMLACFAACGAKQEEKPQAAEPEKQVQAEEKPAEEAEPEQQEAEQQEEEQEQAEPVSLTVFAAASLQESLNQIAELYKQEHPETELMFTFDSSGTLKRQIAEGADCDLFIAASQKPMNQLDITADPDKNVDGLDFVKSETRIDLLENKVTLVVPEGNPKGIKSFDQLSELLKNGEVLLGMGNSDVPVGQYTLKIFNFYGLEEAQLADAGVLTYGSNVKEVTTQVTEAAVDCGVIYATDAFSAGLEVVDTATADMCGRAIYPAAVLKISTHQEEAQAFLDFLQTEAAMEVFEAIGFSNVQ